MRRGFEGCPEPVQLALCASFLLWGPLLHPSRPTPSQVASLAATFDTLTLVSPLKVPRSTLRRSRTMYPRTLALLLFVLPTLLDAQTLAESSSLQRLFDRLAHCNRVAAHRSALALSVTSVPEAIAAPVEEPFCR